MRRGEGTSRSWQRRMLDSEMYADVIRHLKGVKAGKAKAASLKRVIRSAANRKLERNIKNLQGTRGNGDFERMRRMLLDRPTVLLN